MAALGEIATLLSQSEATVEEEPARRRPSAAELLTTPGAFLYRTDLRALGLERRAVDATFKALDVFVLDGYSRPMIRAADFLAFVERCTYRDDRVRPT